MKRLMQKSINSILASDATLLLCESSGEVSTVHNNPVCITINTNAILRTTYVQAKECSHQRACEKCQTKLTFFVNLTPP